MSAVEPDTRDARDAARESQPVPPDAAVKQSGFAPRFGKAPLQWLIEAPLIVISVALGLWVTQFQQARADRELAARVLESLHGEIQRNLTTLDPYVAVHRQWMDALAKADTSDKTQSALDLFFRLRPRLPANSTGPFPFLRRSAWDAALSGGAIRLIDLDAAGALSDIYRMQEIAVGNVDRLSNGVLTSPAIFDPASRAPGLRMMWLTLADIQSAESTVLELYRRHLPTIRAAADAAR